MANFEFPHDVRDAYERRLRVRVDAAADALDAVLERLEGLERASPSTWDAALREAEAAYKQAFGFQANLELAESLVDEVSSRQANAWANARPDTITERGAALPQSDRQQAVKTQLEAIEALVGKYYANLRDKAPTDDSGFIVLAAATAAVKAERGIARRRATYYATDQTGLVYRSAYKHAAGRAGVDEYIWGRTTSANPRDRHLARVGNRYSLSDAIDHPGEAHNCKCDMLPVPD